MFLTARGPICALQQCKVIIVMSSVFLLYFCFRQPVQGVKKQRAMRRFSVGAEIVFMALKKVAEEDKTDRMSFFHVMVRQGLFTGRPWSFIAGNANSQMTVVLNNTDAMAASGTPFY